MVISFFFSIFAAKINISTNFVLNDMGYTIITCVNQKNAIGNNGDLLYHIKNDMVNFKSMTTDNVVIMGRKTFESLPNMKPLPNRINIIITHDKNYSVTQDDNVYIVNSIQDAKELCETLFSDKEWFVIGGSSIYNEFLKQNLISEMRVTYIADDADGDTIFPSINNDEWKTYYTSSIQHDEKTDKNFVYKVLKKK